jgi:FkbM family methyltransferase
MVSWRRRAINVLGGLGAETTDVGPSGVLVSRRDAGFAVDPLDESTWLVRRGEGEMSELKHYGRADAGAHLFVDVPLARSRMIRHERVLNGYLAREHIAWLLRRVEVNCVLDVGANTGQFGRQLRRTGYRGRIVSFEPLEEFVEQVRGHAAGDPDWVVVPHALGDTDTEMTINARPGAMSSLLPSSAFGKQWHPRLRQVEHRSVSVRRLDGLYDDAVAGLANPRVFLKLDTQGYDLKAFAGAGDRIDDVLGLQSEVSCVPIYDGMPHMTQAIATYEQAGFETTGMFQVNRDPASMRVIEFDVVMVRPHAVAVP